MHNKKNYFYILGILSSIVFMVFSCDPSTPKLPSTKGGGHNLVEKTLPQIAAVYAGTNHTAAITNTGALYTWGFNHVGQLGLGNSRNGTDKPTQVGKETHWQSITAGSYYTLALTNSGALYAWGRNTHGQLGLKDIIDKNKPTAVLMDIFSSK